MFNYSDKHMEFVHTNRLAHVPWAKLAKDFNKKFKCDQSSDALRLAYSRHKELLEAGLPEVDVALLRQARSSAKTSAKNRKALNLALDAIDLQESILERMQAVVDKSDIKPIKKPAKSSKKKPTKAKMVMEVLLSDLHYGKLTDDFHLAEARARMRKYSAAVVNQYEMQTALGYNISSIDLAFLGDIIESATMHGVESLKSCEFGNSEQVTAAIDSIFHDFIVPVAQTGAKLKALCVTGNHSRVMPQKTFIKPGKEHLSWIIYNTLEMLCKKTEIDISFQIAEGPTLVHTIFTDTVLYEHYDLVNTCTKKGFLDMLAKRQSQLGQIIDFYRGGHWHELTIFDRGRIIVNGCLPGADGYSESLGFSTESVQAINFYCRNQTRPNSYYYTFPVYLGGGDE